MYFVRNTLAWRCGGGGGFGLHNERGGARYEDEDVFSLPFFLHDAGSFLSDLFARK